MDNTSVWLGDHLADKARTAARLRRPDPDLQQRDADAAGRHISPRWDFAAADGISRRFPAGRGVARSSGAVGCSGATGDQDAVGVQGRADTLK
jgi:uncharacterized protein GlcG (DUF336 family)